MQETGINIGDFYTSETFAKIKEFSKDKETPFLVTDSSIIKKKYEDLEDFFPFAKVYYAVKANPDINILKMLSNLGSNYDIASVNELDKVLSLGVEPSRCSFGNTIKKTKDIKYAYEKGVRLFATDSEADLLNIAKFAPNSKIYVRVLTEGSHTADWPLSRKFGCQIEMAIELLVQAQDLGLVPYGVSFHVGSQQRDIGAWDSAIGKIKVIFEKVEEKGIILKMINMGGGFPGSYLNPTHEIVTYAEEIKKFLVEDFGEDLPEIILEPGRSLCADAGVLVSEIVLISRKSNTSLHRWIYTDVGMFTGLMETLNESIKYPIYYEKEGELEPSVIAGPTCDSADIMYEHEKYSLPLDLEIGDRLYWFSTGAYTTSYSSIEFNGFTPLKQYVID